MTYETILFEVADGYAVITLNRPERLNAFTAVMHAELRDALDRVSGDDDIRALILTGAGRGFCPGQDLNDRVMGDDDAPPPDLGHTIETLYNPLVRRIRSLELPVICAVNGVAAGAGANIALGCDLVMAARSAKFIQAFCRIGLVPDGGGTWLLPHLAGRAKAMAMALLGEAVEAEEAERIGLIWKVVEDEVLMDEARKLAAHLATQPTAGLAAIKQLITAAPSNSLDEQLDLERDTQRKLGHTHDYREGVRAFLGKRKPQFRGN
jgi:2-(1,2-epoxy-1,2-dihydrophenyl)acetyl-CoA isomerase